MALVVIDKNWLQGTATETIIDFATKHRLLVPAALGYEIFTDEEEKQKEICFGKLIKVQPSIELIEPVGSLIQYEIQNHCPCHPIEDRTLKIDFQFNPNLSKPNFPLQKEQIEHIEWFRDHWEITGLSNFKNFSARVTNLLPELLEIKAISSHEAVQPIKEKLARDSELIKRIYNETKPRDYPSSVMIDENWALYRWLQLCLIASVEYTRMYGINNAEAVAKRLKNEYVDLQYCVTGILTKAFATKEPKLKTYFRLCCPGGNFCQ